jgi:tetratricopeptide (TPR) repeat protein
MAQLRYNRAIADFTKAIELDPTYVTAYSSRGLAWQKKSQYENAIADFTEVIRLDPTDFGAYHDRGDTQALRLDYDKAIADYSEAIRLLPTYAAAYHDRGLAWAAEHEHDQAIADLSEAIRLDPDEAAPYSRRAWIWATCPDAAYRDGKRAVESATRACEISEWNDPNDMNTLAAACAEAGDWGAAVKWQSKAIEQSSDEKQKADYRTRLSLYRDKRPYREPPRPKS